MFLPINAAGGFGEIRMNAKIKNAASTQRSIVLFVMETVPNS
jgi:hypothetical protein